MRACGGSFAANDFDDTGMGVAEGVDGDAAQEVQIFFAGGVEDVGAAAVGDDERVALVGGKKKLIGIAQTGVSLGLEKVRE